MHSLEINYGDLGEPVLIQILQVADQMDVPPKVALKAWLRNQCEFTHQEAPQIGSNRSASSFRNTSDPRSGKQNGQDFPR